MITGQEILLEEVELQLGSVNTGKEEGTQKREYSMSRAEKKPESSVSVSSSEMSQEARYEPLQHRLLSSVCGSVIKQDFSHAQSRHLIDAS